MPRTVQDLIEEAPEAPSLEKSEADVSVLFVDIVAYTRLAQRLDPAGSTGWSSAASAPSWTRSSGAGETSTRRPATG